MAVDDADSCFSSRFAGLIFTQFFRLRRPIKGFRAQALNFYRLFHDLAAIASIARYARQQELNRGLIFLAEFQHTLRNGRH